MRYRSFKDVDLRWRVSFMSILAMPLVFVLLFQNPPQVLFLTFLVYALSGPLGFVFRGGRPTRPRTIPKNTPTAGFNFFPV